MHGINQLLSHHGHNSDSRSSQDSKSSSGSSTTSDTRQQDTRILQELLNQKHDGRLYLHGKQLSRGSVSSTYSYGTSSCGSSHGSGSSSIHHHSVYHTIHGSSHHHSSSNHHHYHHHHHHHHHPLHHIHHRQSTSGRASPTSPSPTNDSEKQQRHHHHSIQEMIKHFGRRLGHIRRQSECQEAPRRREEDFRNRSQSLDGGSRHHPVGLLENDCETTYRIYESIIRQGNESRRDLAFLPAI